MKPTRLNEGFKAFAVAPGAATLIRKYAQAEGFSERLTDLAGFRCVLMIYRIGSHNPSILPESVVMKIIKRCFMRAERDLLLRLRGLDPTMDEATARRILDLPPSNESMPPEMAKPAA